MLYRWRLSQISWSGLPSFTLQAARSSEAKTSSSEMPRAKTSYLISPSFPRIRWVSTISPAIVFRKRLAGWTGIDPNRTSIALSVSRFLLTWSFATVQHISVSRLLPFAHQQTPEKKILPLRFSAAKPKKCTVFLRHRRVFLCCHGHHCTVFLRHRRRPCK